MSDAFNGIPAPIIRHEKYKATVEGAISAIQRARPGGFVWIIGPSGAGKSEVRYEVMRELAGKAKFWKDGRLPAVSVRVALTDRNKFNPKDLALRLVMAIRTPNLSWLTPRGEVASPDIVHLQDEVNAVAKDWNQLRLSSTEHGLRSEFENSASIREVKWVFFEEVSSFLEVHKQQDPHNYMVGLMQMAEEIGCVMVLIGTHLARDLWLHSRDVANRSQWVWFHRYNEQNNEDLKPFASMVKSMGSRFSLGKRDLLLQNLELVLLNGGGVYGPTWNYLVEADKARESSGEPMMTIDHLEAASGTSETHISLWNYVRDFEDVANRTKNLDLALVAESSWAQRGRTEQ